MSRLMLFLILACFAFDFSFAGTKRSRKKRAVKASKTFKSFGFLKASSYKKLSYKKRLYYSKALKKSMYLFERELRRSTRTRLSSTDSERLHQLFELFIPSAFAYSAQTHCIVGGVVRAKRYGKCPTTGRSCKGQSNSFLCGVIYGNTCVSRTPIATLSQRCHDNSSSEAIPKERYDYVQSEIGDIVSQVCESSDSSNSPCGRLKTRIQKVGERVGAVQESPAADSAAVENQSELEDSQAAQVETEGEETPPASDQEEKQPAASPTVAQTDPAECRSGNYPETLKVAADGPGSASAKEIQADLKVDSTDGRSYSIEMGGSTAFWDGSKWNVRNPKTPKFFILARGRSIEIVQCIGRQFSIELLGEEYYCRGSIPTTGFQNEPNNSAVLVEARVPQGSSELLLSKKDYTGAESGDLLYKEKSAPILFSQKCEKDAGEDPKQKGCLTRFQIDSPNILRDQPVSVSVAKPSSGGNSAFEIGGHGVLYVGSQKRWFLSDREKFPIGTEEEIETGRYKKYLTYSVDQANSILTIKACENGSFFRNKKYLHLSWRGFYTTDKCEVAAVLTGDGNNVTGELKGSPQQFEEGGRPSRNFDLSNFCTSEEKSSSEPAESTASPADAIM